MVSAGVTPGDRVAVQVDEPPEAAALYLACLRGGTVYLPLNTVYTPTEFDYYIGDAEANLLVMTPAIHAAASETAARHGGCRMLHGHDFREGVRARVIDKDGASRWWPACLEDVLPEDVERYFAPL